MVIGLVGSLSVVGWGLVVDRGRTRRVDAGNANLDFGVVGLVRGGTNVGRWVGFRACVFS